MTEIALTTVGFIRTPSSRGQSWAPVVPGRRLAGHTGSGRSRARCEGLHRAAPAAGSWLALLAITVRSGIHLFSADGGAQSIATIDTKVAGGDNIIAVFGQWGATQLLLALLLWFLLLRYRGVLPLVILVLLIEPFFRAGRTP